MRPLTPSSSEIARDQPLPGKPKFPKQKVESGEQRRPSTSPSTSPQAEGTTAIYPRRCLMARLVEEHEESDDEFPDISVVISRFYQNKLSKSPNEERSHATEPGRTSAKDPQTPRDGD